MGTCDQVEPFHSSARLLAVSAGEYWPTAMHQVLDTQEIALRYWNWLVLRPGLGTTDHVVPFQVSLRTAWVGACLS